VSDSTLTQQTNSPEILLRAPDVAKRLSVSVAYAYRLMQNGALPVIRIGRSLRCPSNALDEWIKRNTATPVAA
jgi:excisionase family DNA binding protein